MSISCKTSMGICHVLKIILLFVTLNHSFPACFPSDISLVMLSDFKTNTVIIAMKACKILGICFVSGRKQNQTLYNSYKAK